MLTKFIKNRKGLLMATNLWLVMRKHLKAKAALRKFTNGKKVFNINDVKILNQLDADIEELENHMMVFIPKNFLTNQLNEILK